MDALKEIFTTFEIAQLCSVDITTVINWINAEKLKAYKTPGGHRRVKRQDLLDFFQKYNMPVPAEMIKDSAVAVVVDDEAEIRKMVIRVLHGKWPDLKIYEAEDGFAAGKMVSDHVPSLVVLDIKLPGIDGKQVCQIIRRDDRLKNTKIIAITGFDSPEVRSGIIAAGADGYLPKPFMPQDLIKSVEQFKLFKGK